MLSRAEIDQRLAHLKSLDRYDPDFDDRCVEALETAKRLGQELDEARATIKRLNRRCTKAENERLREIARAVCARPLGVKWDSEEFISWFDHTTKLAFDYFAHGPIEDVARRFT